MRVADGESWRELAGCKNSDHDDWREGKEITWRVRQDDGLDSLPTLATLQLST